MWMLEFTSKEDKTSNNKSVTHSLFIIILSSFDAIWPLVLKIKAANATQKLGYKHWRVERNLKCFDVKRNLWNILVTIIVLSFPNETGTPDNLWSSRILGTTLQSWVITRARSTDACAHAWSKDINAHTHKLRSVSNLTFKAVRSNESWDDWTNFLEIFQYQVS
jgi:hypothetical protein